MDTKKVALLAGAVCVAGVTALTAKSMFGAAAAPVVMAAIAPQPTGPQVLVADKPLPVGTIIGPSDVRFQPWPKQLVSGAYYVRGAAGADPAKLQGMVVRTGITAGQPVTQGALVSPQDRGFLAAALTPGMRAVTVSVTAASGVAGFVFPGDRVDLTLTQQVTGTGLPLNAAETIVRNLRVLATDQRYDNKPDDSGKTEVKSFSLVTLEATPRIVEKIEVAEKIGTLSLSLRPLADNTQELEQQIAAGDVKVPAGTDPKAAADMMVQVASRPQDNDPSFTTGGQVSRFQRNSVPAQSEAAPAQASGAAGSQQPGAAVPTGPVVLVARGNTVIATPVGTK